MKKLFISCPVKGRKLEDIMTSRKKMHAIAEIIFEQELEVIDSVMAKEIINGDSFESLVHHINCMKNADYFIGIEDYYYIPNHPHIDVTHECTIAEDYKELKRAFVNLSNVCPDLCVRGL